MLNARICTNSHNRMEYVLEGYGNHPTLRKYSVEYLKGKTSVPLHGKYWLFSTTHTSPLPEWPYWKHNSVSLYCTKIQMMMKRCTVQKIHACVDLGNH